MDLDCVPLPTNSLFLNVYKERNMIDKILDTIQQLKTV